jgi:hypothetical protein
VPAADHPVRIPPAAAFVDDVNVEHHAPALGQPLLSPSAYRLEALPGCIPSQDHFQRPPQRARKTDRPFERWCPATSPSRARREGAEPRNGALSSQRETAPNRTPRGRLEPPDAAKATLRPVTAGPSREDIRCRQPRNLATTRQTEMSESTIPITTPCAARSRDVADRVSKPRRHTEARSQPGRESCRVDCRPPVFVPQSGVLLRRSR